MLKKLIRFTSYAFVLLGFSATGTSCGDDEDDLCYKCEGEFDNGYVSFDLDGTYCFSDYNDDYTKEEFKEQIAYFEDYGVDCDKK